jgi:isopropylmalate/homocitrate/citramalate synthase
VGKSAFAHKGSVHVIAVLKDSATWMRLTETDSSVEKAVEDYCWGV